MIGEKTLRRKQSRGCPAKNRSDSTQRRRLGEPKTRCSSSATLSSIPASLVSKRRGGKKCGRREEEEEEEERGRRREERTEEEEEGDAGTGRRWSLHPDDCRLHRHAFGVRPASVVGARALRTHVRFAVSPLSLSSVHPIFLQEEGPVLVRGHHNRVARGQHGRRRRRRGSCTAALLLALLLALSSACSPFFPVFAFSALSLIFRRGFPLSPTFLSLSFSSNASWRSRFFSSLSLSPSFLHFFPLSFASLLLQRFSPPFPSLLSRDSSRGRVFAERRTGRREVMLMRRASGSRKKPAARGKMPGPHGHARGVERRKRVITRCALSLRASCIRFRADYGPRGDITRVLRRPELGSNERKGFPRPP